MEQTIKKTKPYRLYLSVIAFFLIVGIAIYAYCNYVYGEGGYSGYVRLIHKVGYVKTWEGELDKRKLGGSFNEKDIFYFSVVDENVAHKIEQYEQSGDWVTVHYKEYLTTLFWSRKTTFAVYDVTSSGKEVENIRSQK